MNRKIVLLNILLLALLVWLGVKLRASWLESKTREQAALARAAKPGETVVPPSAPLVAPSSPAEYIDVAQKMLFSKDRDPNVIIDTPPPPPPPPPEPPVPPLPKYYGQMAFGEPVIVLSTEKTPQKSYKAGDKVGEFKIAEFDRDTVTLEWNTKKIKSQLKELTPKEEERVAQAPAPAPAAQGPSVAKMGGAQQQPKSDPALGTQNGMYRTCVDSDTSPDGTILNGYKKVIVAGLMGRTCQWEPIR